MMEQLNFAQK